MNKKNETATATNETAKTHGRLRWVFGLLVILLVLVIGAYLFVGSNLFIQRVVLPRIEAQTGADIRIGKARLRPLRGLTASDIAIVTTDGMTLGTGKTTIRYNPFAFLSGGFEITSMEMTDWTLTRTIPAAIEGEEPLILQMSNGTLMVKGLKTGGTGTISFTGNLKVRKEPDLVVEDAAFNLNADVTLTKKPKIQPSALNFSLTVDSLQGRAAGTPLDSTEANIELVVETGDTTSQLRIETFTAIIKDSAGEFLNLMADGVLDTESKAMSIDYTVKGPNHRLLNTLGEVFGGWSFGTVEAESRGSIGRTATGGFVAIGESSLRNLQIRNVKRGVERAPSLDGTIEYNIEVDPQNQSAHLKTVQVDVRQYNDQPLLEISLDKPALLNWNAQTKTATEQKAELTCRLTDFDLTLTNLFQPTDTPSVKVSEGTASMQITAELDGKDISLQGASQVKNLAFSTPTRAFDGLRVEKTFAATVADMSTLTAQAVAETRKGEILVMKTETNMEVNLKEKTGVAEFVLLELDKRIFDFFVEPEHQQVIIDSIDVTGRAAVVFDVPNKKHSVTGNLAIANFIALDPQSGIAPPLDSEVKFEAEAAGETLELIHGSFVARDATSTPVDIVASSIIFLPAAHEGSELSLTSEAVDIGVLQETAKIFKSLLVPSSSDGAEPLATAEADPAADAESSASVESKPRDLLVTLGLKNVKYGEIVLDETTGKIRITDTRIELSDIVGDIQDGSLALEGYAVLKHDENPGELSVAVDFEDIDLQPFAETFVSAKFANQVQGKLSTGRFTAESDTLDPARLKESIKGDIQAQMEVLSIEQTDWLIQLSQGLGVKELETLKFNRGTLNATVENAVVDVQRLLLISDQLQIRTSGQAELGGDVSLETGLAFAGELLEKVARGELAQHMIDLPNEFRQFPTMLKTSGRTKKPNVNVARFIKELALFTGREALREKIREKVDMEDEQIDEGIKLLEGILGGSEVNKTESPEQTPDSDSTSTPDDSRQKRRDLIRGLIDEATK